MLKKNSNLIDMDLDFQRFSGVNTLEERMWAEASGKHLLWPIVFFAFTPK